MSMIDDSQLIDLLTQSEAISPKDLRRGVGLAKKHGKMLYETLVEHDLIDERALVKGIGKFLNVRPVWLGDRTPDEDITARVPRSLALRNKVLPLKAESGGDRQRLVLAMYDPLDVLAMDEIASHTGVDVRPVLAGPGDLARALERVYGGLSDHEEDATDLEALEQAVSGEFDAQDFEAELIEDVDQDGLEDDSWATFFDQAEDVDYTEDSAVISRDMKDRAISSVLDAVDPPEDEDEDEDSLKSLDEPLSKSQITGGIQPDLGDWDVDGALDGQKADTDYAKIGQLFVYSPEKAAAHSDPVEKEAKAQKSEVVDDEPSEVDDESVDQTNVSASPFRMSDDELSEASEPVVLEEVAGDEPSEGDDEDDFEDTGSHTAFGFGPASLRADSEQEDSSESVLAQPTNAQPANAQPANAEPSESSDVRSTQKNHAVVFEKAKKMTEEADLNEVFIRRLTELGDLDEQHQTMLEDASPTELIYAAVLALAQSDMLDVHELVEFLKK